MATKTTKVRKRKLKKKIWVTASFAGFHHWPNAPKEVAFLRTLHRHKFEVRVEVSVEHSDRDVEFFILQSDVIDGIGVKVHPDLKENPAMSCEDMAEVIFEWLTFKLYKVLSVEVSEDGENGGVVYV